MNEKLLLIGLLLFMVSTLIRLHILEKRLIKKIEINLPKGQWDVKK